MKYTGYRAAVQDLIKVNPKEEGARTTSAHGGRRNRGVEKARQRRRGR